MDTDGSNLKGLTDTSRAEGEFSCSPDGQRIVYDSGGIHSKIMVMNIDGSGKLCLIEDDADTSYSHLVLSPDGNRLVFSSYSDVEEDSDIYVIDADGGSLNQLTDTNDYDESDPAWSPDGTRIMFSSCSHEEEDSDIYVIDADGGNMTQLTDTRRGVDPEWSPDGTRIIFRSRGNLYVINADGSNKKRLATGTSDHAWSPDSSQIAFASGNEIYMINADGFNERKLASSNERIIYFGLAWSPDGSKIVCVSSEYTFVPSYDPLGGSYTTKGHEQDRIYIMDADGSHKTYLTDDLVSVIVNPQWVPRKK